MSSRDDETLTEHTRRVWESRVGQNRRYLEALSKVSCSDDSPARMRRVGQRVRCGNRSYRAMNPVNQEDVKLLRAVMRGEHCIQGFRNSDIRVQLYPDESDRTEQRRQSQRVGRILKLLHAHQLTAKIPHSRRWRVSKEGFGDPDNNLCPL